MSEKIWSDDAWEDYLLWQNTDKKIVKRINQLIKDIERNGCSDGIGKPEALTGDLGGEFSRRIDDKIDWSTIWKINVFLSCNVKDIIRIIKQMVQFLCTILCPF